MTRMARLFKNHKWAILLALMAAAAVALPQIYLRYDNRDIYQGIEILGGIGDERSWLSRVREAQDGYPALGNAYFKEGKDDPYIIQPLGSAIIAYLGKLFSLDINNTLLLFRLLFPFLVFILIYGFLVFFTKEKLAALATSAFLFFGNTIFSRQAIFRILSGEPPSPYYLNYTRPVNPLMTHFFFYGFLLFFWLFITRKQWRWGIISTVFLGLSFYDYFYNWTFLYAFLGVLALIYLFQKKWRDLKRIGLVILGASLIAIPYLFNLYQATTWPAYAEVKQRVGVIENQTPVIGIVAPSLFVIILLFFPRKWKERYYFALALVTAPLIVLNQQIITGKILQTAHYHWNYHLPLAIIFLSIIFFLGVSKIKWQMFKKTSAILIILISLFTSMWVQNSSYAKNKESVVDRQRYGAPLNWLSQNTEKDEVVFSDNETSRLIVVYTPLNVFYHSTARGTLAATHERLLDALFLYYRLDGIGKDQIQEIFFRDRSYISWTLYGMYYQEAAGGYQNIPDQLLLDLAQEGKESFSVSSSDFFKEMLQKYQVKYLLWDKRDYPLWNLEQYQFLEEAAEFGDFIIYKKI